MAIYIQKIQTNWTKASRGNPNSTLRNSVPEKLPITTTTQVDSVFLQEIIYNEGKFTKPSKIKLSEINEIQIREQRLDLNEINNQLEISFWTENQIKKKAGIINFNSWCQIKTNRRFPMEDTWGYYKIVYNIFYGEIYKATDIVRSKKKEFDKDYQTLLR
jgi:phenylalanine-4-hydroxylase